MVILIDGGFSYVTEHITDEYDKTHPLWNSQFLTTQPQAIIETHRDYVKAGCEILITNTYQASIDGFKEHLGLELDECYNVIKRAVELARQAVDEEAVKQPNTGKKVQIAGSVGPYGACLHDGSEYTGAYCDGVTAAELTAWHRPRMTALAQAGVDLFAIETIPALFEAEALLHLLKEFPDKKAWLSFSCKDGSHTSRGDVFKEAVERCWQINSEQLVAVGANCVAPALVSPLLKSLGSFTYPVIIYANSGEVYDHQEG
uniref:Putative homocysteine S-methyltransferase n=2 Tax=Nilaparvata lugens TaxID=108931 RepID=A0A1S6KZA8_NILLU|nr:putative homocysteine S-methyltransferase [Nilaparvata lugens]